MADDDLWERHKHRKEVTWVSYAERLRQPSTGARRYVDDGQTASVFLEVAGYGELVISVTAAFDDTTQGLKWDKTAVMSARINDEVSGESAEPE